MYRDLREAEKHLFSPPKADRKELFSWLRSARLASTDAEYGWTDDGFRKLTKAERAEAPARELAEYRESAAKFYRNKPLRQAVGYAVAGYFGKQDIDFNRLRKRLAILGFNIKPWSQQSKRIREYGAEWGGDENSPQTWFVKGIGQKGIGQHLGLRKPPELAPWLRAGEQFESPVTRHNDAWKHCREAREHVERLRADIKALEAGEVVNLESQEEVES
jgi:hypothetical protein